MSGGNGVQFSKTTTHHTYTEEEKEEEEDEETEEEEEEDGDEDGEEKNSEEGQTSSLSSKGTLGLSGAGLGRKSGKLVSAMTKKTRKKPLKQRKMLTRSFSLVPERLTGISPTAQKSTGERSLFCCEYALQVLMVILIVMTLPFSLIACLKVIPQYVRAVVFRLGRLLSKGAIGPGLVFLLPCLDTMKRVDLRTFTFDVPTQEVLTKDSVTVAVDAVVYYRIFDPVMSVVNVEDANRSTKLLAQTTLRNVLGTVDLYQLLTDRQDIAAMMQETLDVATDTWGVKVERVEVKDVRLPQQLQRAMAAEAEATREARAKVIAAEGEQLASKPLKAAALEISKCPIALQLRYLQTLNSISAEKNSTIIFPLPVDIVRHFTQSQENEDYKNYQKRHNHSHPPYQQETDDKEAENSRKSPPPFDEKEDVMPTMPSAPSEYDVTV